MTTATFGAVANTVKFIIDDEQKTIMFYFPKKALDNVVVFCIKRGVSLDKATDVLTNKFMEITEIVSHVRGRDLSTYLPDLKMLPDDKFLDLKPTQDMDILFMKEIKIPKKKEEK